ncbi:MAG TPA: glucose 1-dehydrogenase [Acidimicrobiales bacterium]|nr:glucose 1-dehydrogenase [Acidimicrobiales bacterium]
MAGKVAVITGGASGFGAATAALMAAEGASVVLADLQEDLGAAVAGEIGPAALFVRCDVSREEDVAGLVDTAVGRFGRLDVMFNNAGIVGAVGPIDEIPLEEYEFTMGVLLRSVFLGMKHAARVMKQQESGVILSTSSIAGVMGGLGPHVYTAAKSAIVGLTRNVAAELGPWGIRVAAIVPGNHATPMTADVSVGDHTAVDRAVEKFRQSKTPLRGRPGLATDIAHAALWLSSDDAGFVSGTALVVDGGLTTGSREGLERGSGNFGARKPLIRQAGLRGLD